MEQKGVKLDLLIVEYPNHIEVAVEHGAFVVIEKNSASLWMLNALKNPDRYDIRIKKA